MNLPEKILLIGEELVGEKERELLPRLKNVLQELMEGRGGVLRKTPIIRVNPRGCWEFSVIDAKKGYGHISVKNYSEKSHRYFYKKLIGEIPEGLTIDHLCRNRACCNPNHLEPVTLKENINRCPKVRKVRENCKKGHLMDEKNAVVRMEKGKIKRRCRICRNENYRKWWSRTRTHRIG